MIDLSFLDLSQTSKYDSIINSKHPILRDTPSNQSKVTLGSRYESLAFSTSYNILFVRVLSLLPIPLC